jgi:hypothetical protein
MLQELYVWNDNAEWSPTVSSLVLVGGEYVSPYTGRVWEEVISEYLPEHAGESWESLVEQKVIAPFSNARYDAFVKRKHYNEWKQITEEHWWEMYEILPPFREYRGDNVRLFRIAELTCSDYRDVLVHIGDKYYTACRPDTMSNSELLAELKSIMEEL